MTSLPTDEPPREILNRLISGFWTTQAIYVAVRLRIPDLLSGGPRTTESLAAETETHARSLYRLLRAFSSTGVFREDEQLFDRQDVVDRARSNLLDAGVAEHCQFVAGDFFKQVPSGANAYLLRHVLHDWDDVQSATILQRCYEAMSAESRLLIAEFVLPDGPEPFQGKWFDLAMMVVTGGQERTEAEYRSLLDSAGFVCTHIVSTGSELSIIEARRR